MRSTSTIYLYRVRSRCLHCPLSDIMACRQTLCILFFRPQSSLYCRMRHLRGGDSLRRLIAIVSKLFLGGSQLLASVRPQLQRWAQSVLRLTTNCSRWLHSTRSTFFITSYHPGVTRTTRWGPMHTSSLLIQTTSLIDNNFINRMLY